MGNDYHSAYFRTIQIFQSKTVKVSQIAHLITPFDPIPDFTAYCKITDLKGVTIGVPRNTFNGSSCVVHLMDSFESALRTLRSAGANVVDNAHFPPADDFKSFNQKVKGIVRSSEFRRDIVDYLTTLETSPNHIHSVEDIINFSKTSPAEDYTEHDSWASSVDSGRRH